MLDRDILKVRSDKVIRIENLYKNYTIEEISTMTGISQGNVRMIINDKGYYHCKQSSVGNSRNGKLQDPFIALEKYNFLDGYTL